MNDAIELKFKQNAEGAYSVEFTGSLAGKTNTILETTIPCFDRNCYVAYQQAYRQQVLQARMVAGQITVITQDQLNRIRQHLDESATNVLQMLNDWGSLPQFAEIKEAIDPRSENLRVTISTECTDLRRLPLHKWNLFPDNTEVIFSEISARKLERTRHPDKIRILVIRGNDKGISEGIKRDRQAIEDYCKTDAEIVFLPQESKEELTKEELTKETLTAKLADPLGWDIIFFSGHSGEGKISINLTEDLTMEELKDVLAPAIAKRVQIFIFNSCDGLKLAPDLEKLNIDRLIVMRELIPDEVAQKFLKNFLRAFTRGARFDEAVKVARQQLVDVEDKYPYASWLPIVIQNRLVPSPTWQSLGKIRSPYKGLAAFTEADADNFYGREEIVDRVADLVSQEPLVPIVGASGSGKSSLVQAGLIPKLRQDSKCKWQILKMRPGSKPFDALAQAIVNSQHANLESMTLDIELASDAHALTQKLAQMRTPQHRLLLFIDQFEELFTQVTDPAICQKFLQSLADAVRNAPEFTLVFTLRDDFSSKLQNNVQDDDFRPLLERYRPQPLVGMTRDRLKAAITEPVAKLNVEFEGGLVDRLVQDVGNDAGSLPLLQLVLDLLWQQQQPRLLTNKAYEAICGEKGLKIVLANFAEKIYDGYVQQDKVKEFKQVFLRLVTLGDGNTPNTRRTATRAAIDPDIGADNWRKIVVPLSTERLLKTSVDEKTQEETVEVIHETLIQSWQRLTGWIEDYRQELERIAEIEAAAIKWDRNKRSKQDLWGGKKLKEARKFSKDRDRFLKLESIANNFLVASSQKQLFDRAKLWGLGMILPPISLVYIQRELSIQSLRSQINENQCYQSDESNVKLNSAIKGLGNIMSSKVELSNRNLTCLQISKANLSGANFSGANLTNAKFPDADLTNANLHGADLSYARIMDANLSGANILAANLTGASLSGSKLTSVNLSGADLSGANLHGTDLSNANLSWANLSSLANLTGANLTDANLSHTNLTNTLLNGADLTRTNLSNTNLAGTRDLSMGKLGGANFSNANLSNADLSQAYFRGANFLNANLSNADLDSADLTNAKNLTIKQIKTAKNWEKAGYDEEFCKKLGLSCHS